MVLLMILVWLINAVLGLLFFPCLITLCFTFDIESMQMGIIPAIIGGIYGAITFPLHAPPVMFWRESPLDITGNLLGSIFGRAFQFFLLPQIFVLLEYL